MSVEINKDNKQILNPVYIPVNKQTLNQSENFTSQKSESMESRVLKVALPFIALCSPVGKALGFGGCIWQLVGSFDGLYKEQNLAHFGHVVLAVSAAVALVLCAPIGHVPHFLTSGVGHVLDTHQALQAHDWVAATNSLLATGTQVAHLLVMVVGGVELQIASLALQVLLQGSFAFKEYKNEQYLEMGSHLAMGSIQGKWLVQLADQSGHLHKLLNKLTLENFFGTKEKIPLFDGWSYVQDQGFYGPDGVFQPFNDQFYVEGEMLYGPSGPMMPVANWVDSMNWFGHWVDPVGPLPSNLDEAIASLAKKQVRSMILTKNKHYLIREKNHWGFSDVDYSKQKIDELEDASKDLYWKIANNSMNRNGAVEYCSQLDEYILSNKYSWTWVYINQHLNPRDLRFGEYNSSFNGDYYRAFKTGLHNALHNSINPF